MAITIIATPDRIHPGYNPIYWYVDSTNKNQPGFRYIFEIKKCSPFNTPIRELRIAPRPGDGYGYADISKIIQDYLSNDIDFNNTEWINADNNSVFEYQIDFGEEYIASYELYAAVTTGATGSFANQTLISGTNSMPFIVGDQVYVDIDDGYVDCRRGINGYWTVTSVAPGSGLLIINYNTFCVGSQNILSSTIRYADNRRTRVTGLTNSGCVVAFNRAYSFLEFRNYDQSQVQALNQFSEILTNAPYNNFYIYPWQNLYWNFFDDQTDVVGMILFENSNGSQFLMNTCATSVPTTVPYIKQVDVSPNANVYLYSGTGSLVEHDTDFYTVTAIDQCLCGFPESLTILWNDGVAPWSANVSPSGIFNGGYFYNFDDGTNFYVLWYSISDTAYVVTDGLNSTSTTYVKGDIAPGNLPFVPLGTTANGTWNPILFTDFETQNCVPDFSIKKSETRKIYINKRCPINETQILFMDRAGSWSSFAFTLREKRNINSNKRDYRKEFGYLDTNTNEWIYETTDAGLVVYSVTVEKMLTLQTDWMSGEMSSYFEELMTSPEAYLKSNEETDNEWVRITIMTDSLEIIKDKNKKLINYSLQVKFAVNENINI